MKIVDYAEIQENITDSKFRTIESSFLILFKLHIKDTPTTLGFPDVGWNMSKHWYLQVKWENLERWAEILDTCEICGLCWTLHGSLIFVFFSKLALKASLQMQLLWAYITKIKIVFYAIKLRNLGIFSRNFGNSWNVCIFWAERKCCFPQILSFAPNKFTNNMYGHALKMSIFIFCNWT